MTLLCNSPIYVSISWNFDIIFSIPRSRAAELIKGGRVMVNHRPCEKTDKVVEAGDVLTCRGLGKCVLTEIGGTSKRGRTILTIQRYL